MEPISTAALAAIILASKSGATELGKDAGHSAWSGLARLRVLVLRRFSANDGARQALAAAEQRPDDEDAVSRLRDSLEECAAEDDVFAAELKQLVNEARQRPEYQQNSPLFANYGFAGKVNVFGSVRVEKGDFNINLALPQAHSWVGQFKGEGYWLTTISIRLLTGKFRHLVKPAEPRPKQYPRRLLPRCPAPVPGTAKG